MDARPGGRLYVTLVTRPSMIVTITCARGACAVRQNVMCRRMS